MISLFKILKNSKLQIIKTILSRKLIIKIDRQWVVSWNIWCLIGYTVDAQSFSNSFEGVLRVVRKSGRGSSIFVFYCIFMIQFLKVFWGGTWDAPSSPSPPVPILIRWKGWHRNSEAEKTNKVMEQMFAYLRVFISSAVVGPNESWFTAALSMKISSSSYRRLMDTLYLRKAMWHVNAA